MLSRKKTGFSLIELAIVLAVVGVVIGGIYFAVETVRENNRRLQITSQVEQTIANIRHVYFSRTNFPSDLTFAQIKRMGLMPADIIDNGTYYLNAYGNPIVFYADKFITNSTQNVYMSFYGLPKATCLDLLGREFGSSATVRNNGILVIGVHPNFLSQADTADGITMGEALNLCQNSSPYGPYSSSAIANTNEVIIIFRIHG